MGRPATGEGRFTRVVAKIMGHRHPGTGWTVEANPRSRKKPSNAADPAGKIDADMEKKGR